MSCMLYNDYVQCTNKKGKPQQKLQCLFPMYITPIYSIQAYMLTTQNNIRIRKPQCYVVCFWQNGKLQEKAQQYVLEEILLLLQTTTVYAAESAICHCHSRLIYNQPNTVFKNTRNEKIVLFFSFFFVFATAYCQNILQKPSISP